MATKKKQTRLNGKITALEVRLIGPDGEQIGVVSISGALERAEEVGLDLVEISPNVSPPVCRLMDYGKFQYETNKRKQAAKKKQKQIQIKEIKFRPGTDVSDYKIKLRNLIRFLENGDKAKVTLRFRGREMRHQELGLELLKRVEHDLQSYGTVEQQPSMEGRNQMVMVFNPKSGR
ncbi:MAG: translation initiation factor IF-3 [Acidiferrobacterales bacterium]